MPLEICPENIVSHEANGGEALDGPAFGNGLEAHRSIGPLDDVKVERGKDFEHGVGELRLKCLFGKIVRG